MRKSWKPFSTLAERAILATLYRASAKRQIAKAPTN
jgi:hypothetical protein